MDKKKILLVIILFSVLIFVAFTFTLTEHLSAQDKQISPLLAPFINYHAELAIVLATLGVIVGASMFYVMSEKIEVKERALKVNTDLLLRFLGENERAIISGLIEEGKLNQADVSRFPGLTRLKAHRIINKLSHQGLIVIEKRGKINVIKLKTEIADALKN